jgi:hypothetical protein
MLKKLLPLLLLSSVSQAAETVRIYNWTDYIAPDTLKQFEQGSHQQPLRRLRQQRNPGCQADGRALGL